MDRKNGRVAKRENVFSDWKGGGRACFESILDALILALASPRLSFCSSNSVRVVCVCVCFVKNKREKGAKATHSGVNE